MLSFCTSILHDIKVKRGQKKKGKKNQRNKKEVTKKLGSVCRSFLGDKSLHADKGRAF